MTTNGIPALLTAKASTLPYSILTGDMISGIGYTTAPTWGIFSGGSAIITADTVLNIDYKQEWVLSDFPLERGAFETYDKVATPYDVRVRFLAGGSDSKRAALLSSIEAIAGDYNLYDVVTPEVVYLNCNVRHYDYRRTTQNGVGILAVDVWLVEVRVQGSTTVGQTASASGSPAYNGGVVQPTDATPAQADTGAGNN